MYYIHDSSNNSMLITMVDPFLSQNCGYKQTITVGFRACLEEYAVSEQHTKNPEKDNRIPIQEADEQYTNCEK